MVKKFKHRYGRYHRKDIVVLGEVPTDCLDDTTVRLQAKYSTVDNMKKTGLNRYVYDFFCWL